MSFYTLSPQSFIHVRYMGHVTYSNPWIHFTRTADEFIFYFIQSGSLYLKEGDLQYTLKEGDSFLLNPSIEHTGTKASPCDYYFVHFRSTGLTSLSTSALNILPLLKKQREEAIKSSLYLSSIYESWEVSPVYFPKQWHPSTSDAFFSLLEQSNFMFYQQHENYRHRVSLLFQQFLLALGKDFADHLLQQEQIKAHKGLARAQELKDYLDTHYTQKLTSKSLANHFDANYNYLNRLFKSFTGMTIMNYLNKLRIHHAKALMASSTHLHFADIGYLVGIDDPYYFSKLFKKYTGLTATAYILSIAPKEYK
ncbi:AraC family transcriptional regulator [Sporanaerobium hydrogeniformans]|uniref:AraC family transcriptional regulator n=1 Tax=Sporanaerobium hydrogeniformans TaxID=3072179 RepID=UPI0015D50033|nr:AraC family transcriptional regulator [Sporanaerobium hydrogeniformans]